MFFPFGKLAHAHIAVKKHSIIKKVKMFSHSGQKANVCKPRKFFQGDFRNVLMWSVSYCVTGEESACVCVCTRAVSDSLINHKISLSTHNNSKIIWIYIQTGVCVCVCVWGCVCQSEATKLWEKKNGWKATHKRATNYPTSYRPPSNSNKD